MANMLSTIISMIVTLTIPKLIGVESYGYFQLYMLYFTYLGIFHFGWVDGMYLQIGGEEYSSLDKRKYGTQFSMFLFFEFILSLILVAFTLLFVPDENKLFVLVAASICMFIYNSNIFVQFILLATNMLKKYSFIIILDRIIYLALVFLFLFFFKTGSFKGLILADILARTISLVYAVITNRKLLLSKPIDIRSSLTDIKENILIGYKVTFGGIAGIFITGLIRFMIEFKWGIAFFGKVSLTLTLSNLMMIFVNAVSMVVFPILRRTDENQLSPLYKKMNSLLMTGIFCAMVFYYPLKSILVLWLPQYADSLRYMAIVFPIIIYNSKTSMLINTFLKTIRREQVILTSNIISVAVSLVLGILFVFLIPNPNLAIFSIVISLAIRSFLAERKLAGYLDISISKEVLSETVLTLLFIVINWYVNSALSMLLYGAVLLIYVYKFSDITTSIRFIKEKV